MRWEFVLASFLVLILQFPFERSRVSTILSYLLNKSNCKKRKKGQNFWEWFAYSRFKDVLPRSILIRYYSCVPLFIVTVIVTVIICLICEKEIYYRIPVICQISIVAIAGFIDMVSWMGGDVWFLSSKAKPEKILKRKGRNKK